MNDDIRLTSHATPGQSTATILRAIDDSPGQGRRKQLAFALMLLGALLFGGAMTLIGAIPLTVGLVISVAALFGALIGMQIAIRMNGAAIQRLQAADWRWQQGLPMTLRPDGLVLEARLVPWDAGHGTSRLKDATVLHLGRLDTVVIPDADLPPGLSPENLQTKIAGWRSQCPPF
ncbi:hypothetical protein [Gemmobacter serpentinus]|uniref:hypothetical protein n=1 Tax=Gemmobacter serpentinus TaxID=2652247 RepID=UPI00124E20F6|nr:hypothetical protein [Gemmobacter serpentinus]